jgi:hypothetical protein
MAGAFWHLISGCPLVFLPIYIRQATVDLTTFLVCSLYFWSMAVVVVINFVRLYSVRVGDEGVSYVKWNKRTYFHWDKISRVEWTNLVIFLYFGRNKVRLNRLVFEDPVAVGELVLRSLAKYGYTVDGEKATK